MSGETNLQRLLANMRPEFLNGEFAFCSVSRKEFAQLRNYPSGWLRGPGKNTLIVKRSIADDDELDYEVISRMIVFNVYSYLEAAGFLAAVTSKLAGAGICVKTISPFYQYHLFVPTDRAITAIHLLFEMRYAAARDVIDAHISN